MGRKAPPEILTSQLLEHPAVRAWSDLRPERIEPESIHVLRERPNQGVYRLTGVGAAGGDVIAKRSRAARSATERTVYEEVLPHVPVTSPRYYGGEGFGAFGWLFLEDVGQERYSIANDEHRALAGRWLGRLHTFAARETNAHVRGRLPDRGPGSYLEHLRSGRRSIEANLGNPALSAEEVALLRAIVSAHDILEERWHRVESSCEGMPSTLVHGDFRPKNAYLREHPTGLQLFPIDWEMAGWGVPAADLTRVDIGAYHDVVREVWPSVDAPFLAQLAAVGQVFRFLAAIDWDCLGLAYTTRDLISRPMASLRVIHADLTDAARAAGLAN